MKYEITVRPITRWVVGEYHEDYNEHGSCAAGYRSLGEFANEQDAHEVATSITLARTTEGHEVTTDPDAFKMKPQANVLQPMRPAQEKAE